MTKAKEKASDSGHTSRYDTDAAFKEMVDRSVIELKGGRNPSTQDPDVLAYAQSLIDAE